MSDQLPRKCEYCDRNGGVFRKINNLSGKRRGGPETVERYVPCGMGCDRGWVTQESVDRYYRSMGVTGGKAEGVNRER